MLALPGIFERPSCHEAYYWHMGRWKPPRQNASPYVTPAGYQALDEELKDLWMRRAEVVRALSAAAAEGDRSENAEYIYRKRELAGLDRRIRYLQKRLPVLKVVRETPAGDRVFFGARVRLQRDDGKEVEYRIVGADEATADRRLISIDSPMARALLKKGPDDEVELNVGGNCERFRILSVRYDDDAAG
jgi:transcription elongation factor GreB